MTKFVPKNFVFPPGGKRNLTVITIFSVAFSFPIVYNTIQFPGVAQLVARLLWAKTTCAASGRCSRAFLVQRSIKSRIGVSPKILSGTANRATKAANPKFPINLNYYLSGCSAVGSAPALGA